MYLMSLAPYILFAFCIVFGVLRFVLPVKGEIVKGDIYKDLAHVFVGVLIGYALFSEDGSGWLMPVGMTILEIVAFVVRKKR